MCPRISSILLNASSLVFVAGLWISGLPPCNIVHLSEMTPRLVQRLDTALLDRFLLLVIGPSSSPALRIDKGRCHSFFAAEFLQEDILVVVKVVGVLCRVDRMHTQKRSRSKG